MRTSLAAAMIATVLCAAGAAASQDVNAPAYARGSRGTDFGREPLTVNVTSGGIVDAAGTLGGACLGMINRSANYEFTYSGGPNALIMNVRSQADTSLVVMGPNGRWVCDDDYIGLNPAVRFDQPQAGVYKIWVGAVGAPTQGTLTITDRE